MYERFIAANEPITNLSETREEFNWNVPQSLKDLIYECNSSSIGDGLYRIHSIDSSIHWAVIIEKYYPAYLGKLLPFGYDWLGRQFCIHRDRADLILMFDPSTAEDFQLEESLLDFHNGDLVSDRESILSDPLFNEVRRFLNFKELLSDECVGYKVPLFLNGKDLNDNREKVKLEVYWEFQCQIYHQIKDLPEGTKIGAIKFEERK